jgi:hypothetical protein
VHQECGAHGVTRVALVMARGKAALDPLLRDARWRDWGAEALVRLAKKDGWDGVATCFVGLSDAHGLALAGWQRTVAAVAHSVGMVADALPAPDLGGNVIYSRWQDMSGEVTEADRGLLSPGDGKIRGTAWQPAGAGEVDAAQDFAAEHADLTRCYFALPLGLRFFASGRLRTEDEEAWRRLQRECGSPVRTDDGLLTLDCKGGVASYADGAAVIKWLVAAKARGFRGVALYPAENTPSDVWRWLDTQPGGL